MSKSHIGLGYLVVILLTLWASLAEAGHWEQMEEYEAEQETAWKGCHPGYKGMSEEHALPGKKCVDLAIKDHSCFVACYRREQGLVGADGKWNDALAKETMNKMWDTTPEAQAAFGKWYEDTRTCITSFDKTSKWPTDYSGTCPAVGTLIQCIWNARKCKA